MKPAIESGPFTNSQSKACRSPVQPWHTKKKCSVNKSHYCYQQWQPRLPGPEAASARGDTAEPLLHHVVLKPCSTEVPPRPFQIVEGLNGQDSSSLLPTLPPSPRKSVPFTSICILKFQLKTCLRTPLPNKSLKTSGPARPIHSYINVPQRR